MGQPDYSPDDDSGRDKRDDYSPDDDSGRDKRDDWTPTLSARLGGHPLGSCRNATSET